MRRALLPLLLTLASCGDDFTFLEKQALCRIGEVNETCPRQFVTSDDPSAFSATLQVQGVERGAPNSASKVVDARGPAVAWLMTGSCPTLPSPDFMHEGCTSTWDLSSGLLGAPNSYANYVDLPLSSAVAYPRAGVAPMSMLYVQDPNPSPGKTPNLNLEVRPGDARSLAGFYRPTGDADAGVTGAVALTGEARFAALVNFRATLSAWDFDYGDGGQRMAPSAVAARCDGRVEDGAPVLATDSSPAGRAYFSVALPAGCSLAPEGMAVLGIKSGGTGALLVTSVTGWPVTSLRLAARANHVWGAAPVSSGGFALHSFDVSNDGFVEEFATPWTLPTPGDWRQVDVTSDALGRPYLVGDGTLEGTKGVLVASFELDGGLRFMQRIPDSTGARVVAASWSDHGLVVVGDCDAGNPGLCEGGSGAFFALVSVPP